MSLALCLAAASHDGEYVNVSIEACCRQHSGIPGTPLDVEAPLAAGGQLVQHLQYQPGLPLLEELHNLFPLRLSLLNFIFRIKQLLLLQC